MKNKKYKYFIYYLEKDIYAYTDEKSKADNFEKFRDLHLFKKERREISKEEVNILAKNYKLQRLTDYDFLDKDGKNNIVLSITEMEKIEVINHSVNIREKTIYSYCWSPHTIFKKDIKKALVNLKYHIFHDTISASSPLKLIDMFPNIEKEATIDELNVFVKLFGKYLKV